MKNKKKLLLLGVGAMSALALSVGATSTFAWFTATAHVKNAAISAASNAPSVTVDEIHYSLEEEQTVEGLVAAFGSPTIANSASKLELAHVPASTVENYTERVAPGLSTAWRDTGTGGSEATHVHELGFDEDGAPVLASATGTALYAWVDVTITAKADGANDSLGNHYSQEQIANDLNGKYVTVTFTPSDHVRLFTRAEVDSDQADADWDTNLTSDSNTLGAKTVVIQLGSLATTGASARIYYFVNGDTLIGQTGNNIAAGGITAAVSATRTSA